MEVSVARRGNSLGVRSLKQVAAERSIDTLAQPLIYAGAVANDVLQAARARIAPLPGLSV
ncbi:MAG TPA: hypothetical protein VFA03_07570 [Acetobacteraceae bacterium]|nr:hypothetical protein [Acetobacteraceae bacterium]